MGSGGRQGCIRCRRDPPSAFCNASLSAESRGRPCRQPPCIPARAEARRQGQQAVAVLTPRCTWSRQQHSLASCWHSCTIASDQSVMYTSHSRPLQSPSICDVLRTASTTAKAAYEIAAGESSQTMLLIYLLSCAQLPRLRAKSRNNTLIMFAPHC